MLHPRLTPLGSTLGGADSQWLASIVKDPAVQSAWSDPSYVFRWGEGACGLFEVQWTMPLPPGFEHPLLRRGTQVELMDGPYRMGSPATLSEPSKGSGIDDPWTLVATGIGREVEGENSFYAADGAGNATTVPTTAVDQAIVDGWRIAGRDASVPSTAPSSLSTSENLNTVGQVLAASAAVAGSRWGVRNDNLLYFMAEPATATYQVTPGAVALGTADDDYASTVKVRYLDSTTGTYLTRTASDASTAARFGVKQYPVDVTDRGAMSAADAQNIADQTLALAKGRLSWTNGFTLTANEILTMGGTPADLSKVAEDVGTGCMVQVNGIFSDLLEYDGQTWLNLVIGEAKYTDGAPTIDLSPLGLAPRDLASIVERLSGPAAA